MPWSDWQMATPTSETYLGDYYLFLSLGMRPSDNRAGHENKSSFSRPMSCIFSSLARLNYYCLR
jgi:hypothetical protein